MATTTSNSGPGASSPRKPSTTTRKRPAASATTSTQPSTPVEQAQQIAERAVLVPVGAGLIARDTLVSSVRGLTTKISTRESVERELKRYERRGATARNRFERQARKTRTRFERDLRQRRKIVERTVKQHRRKLEREVRSVRKDFDKQSSTLTTRVEKIVGEAQGLIGSVV
jgi:hypothetical protein